MIGIRQTAVPVLAGAGEEDLGVAEALLGRQQQLAAAAASSLAAFAAVCLKVGCDRRRVYLDGHGRLYVANLAFSGRGHDAALDALALTADEGALAPHEVPRLGWTHFMKFSFGFSQRRFTLRTENFCKFCSLQS